MQVTLDPNQMDRILTTKIKTLESQVKNLTTRLERKQREIQEYKQAFGMSLDDRNKMHAAACNLIETLEILGINRERY